MRTADRGFIFWNGWNSSTAPPGGRRSPTGTPGQRDGQQELLEAVCERFRAGEGVACRFFSMNNTSLFIGDHKYWLMNHWDDLESGGNYVINRASLYRDRRDFVIQPGDTGKPEDYPANPAHQGLG